MYAETAKGESRVNAQTGRLKVPGATCYWEKRGTGPVLLLISGGPTDANIYDGLASVLASQFTVITYDPRGNSRSVFDDGEQEDLDMNVCGDDAAVLLGTFLKDDTKAFVFGNSGGAQIGLNLTARYPALVAKLIAHEPPCASLVPDLAHALEPVMEVYRRDGALGALAKFAEVAGMAPSRRTPSDQMLKNFDYFFAHAARPISEYRPDIARLKKGPPITVGVGVASEGQLAYRTAQALARELDIAPVTFPGDHTGWLRELDAFAALIRGQFSL